MASGLLPEPRRHVQRPGSRRVDRELRRDDHREEAEVLLREERCDQQSESGNNAEAVGSAGDGPEHDEEDHLGFEEPRPPLVEVGRAEARERLRDARVEHSREDRCVDPRTHRVGECRDGADRERQRRAAGGRRRVPGRCADQQQGSEQQEQPSREAGIHVRPEQEERRQPPDGGGARLRASG